MRDSRFAVRRPPSVARRTSLTGERPSRARDRPRALCFLLPAGVCCARVGGPCVEVRGFAVHGARFAGSDDKVRPAWRRDWITTRARPRVHTRPSSSPLVVQPSCVRCSPVVRSFVRRQSSVNAERLCPPTTRVAARAARPSGLGARGWSRVPTPCARRPGVPVRARMWSQDADAGTRTSRPREASRAALGQLTVAAAADRIGAHVTYPPARTGAYAPDPTLSSRVIPSYWHHAHVHSASISSRRFGPPQLRFDLPLRAAVQSPSS